MFRDVRPEQLLRYVTDISFGANSEATNGYFYWVRKSAKPEVAYGTHWRPFSPPMSAPVLEDGYFVSGDGESEEKVQDIFELLVSGLSKGSWRVDPNIERAASNGDNGLVDPRDRSLVCEIWIGIDPGEGYRKANETPNSYLITGVIYVGVFYDYDTPRTAEHGDKPEVLGRPLPRLFILGNRTTSHIYLLSETEGVQFHDKAIELYLRLVALKKELSEK